MQEDQIFKVGTSVDFWGSQHEKFQKNMERVADRRRGVPPPPKKSIKTTNQVEGPSLRKIVRRSERM